MTDFIFENHSDEEKEWGKIQENMVWKTNQYMTSSEANVIIVELEKIKQKLLKPTYKQSYDIWNLIHPRISAISKQKFYDRHYSDAVRSAFVEINTRLKKIYKNQRNEEKDGVDLMSKAFIQVVTLCCFLKKSLRKVAKMFKKGTCKYLQVAFKV